MIICIVGPTGVGKTKLSVELAKLFNGEIINADSTQVYKDLNIATAKVTEEEKEKLLELLKCHKECLLKRLRNNKKEIDDLDYLILDIKNNYDGGKRDE